MSIIGVLPMAGSGSRLALPFHKALAPTILPGPRIAPLYTHSYARLRKVTDEVVLVLSQEQRRDPCLSGLPGSKLYKPRRGELPSSIATVARMADPADLIALALPDSVWFPEDGFLRLARDVRGDGILGLFGASSHVLDAVELDTTDGRIRDVSRHVDPPAPVEHVLGWGCFLIRASALVGLTDSLPLAPQLSALNLYGEVLPGSYYDLGTPERYARYHDLVRLNDDPR